MKVPKATMQDKCLLNPDTRCSMNPFSEISAIQISEESAMNFTKSVLETPCERLSFYPIAFHWSSAGRTSIQRDCAFFTSAYTHTHTFPVCTVTIGKCIPTLSAALKCVFNVQCFCLILKKSCIFLNLFYYTILLSLSFLKIFLFKSTFTILCYFDSQNRKKHQQYAILTFLCNDCGR